MKFSDKCIIRTPLKPKTFDDEDDIYYEALYLSSPVFYGEYKKFLTNKSNFSTKELKKILVSSYKYKSRACNRCTPFGLFAGIGICDWKNELNNICLKSSLSGGIYKKTRLDMNVLCSLVQNLCKLPFVKPYLVYYPNSSLYLLGNSYRFIEYKYFNNRKIHKISKVDFSEYLEYILNECKLGLTYNEIIALLTSEEIPHTEAKNFINELIDAQLIFSELEANVIGTEYLEVILRILNRIKKENHTAEIDIVLDNLLDLQKHIFLLDKNNYNTIESYNEIKAKIKSILPGVSEKNLLQTDLFKNFEKKDLDINIQKNIAEVLGFLNKISPIGFNPKLEEFKKRFREQYDENEIPLLEALDVEAGVGYPSKDLIGINPLIDDIYIQKDINENEIKWNLLQSCLLKIIIKGEKSKAKILTVSESDFPNIDFSKDSYLPSSIPILFKVLNSKTNKIEIGGNGGSSSINLLGRFAFGSDELFNLLKEIAEFEKSRFSQNIILAEISHLPENRTGNILSRPKIREYEIPYLAKSVDNQSHQINVNDLYLKIVENRVVLFDSRLKKEVIPRLGNAHNYSSNSLPVYHFLCDLQMQYFSKPFLGFNWGVLSNQFDFLPRIEYKNSVLSPAKWRLRKHRIDELNKKNQDEKLKFSSFLKIKSELELPEKFYISEGDNILLIECNNDTAILAFLDVIKNKNEVLIEEYLFEDEFPLVFDSDGKSYTNECIAILYNENFFNVENSISNSFKFKTKKVFSLGSEWLYYKIYCGIKTADNILSEEIYTLSNELIKDNLIENWFFIRYYDPDFHIRLRFKLNNLSNLSIVISKFNEIFEPLVNKRVISKLLTDTYKRELKRYGENSIELVENLFWFDSKFVCEVLSALGNEKVSSNRWLIVIKSVDVFLTDFNFNLEQKYELVNNLSISFFKEHGGDKNLRIMLDLKYRTFKKQIYEVLTLNENTEYTQLFKLLSFKSKLSKESILKILELKDNNLLKVDFTRLIGSILHMNIDRMFMGKNRTNEFVIYDLLTRYYKGILVQSKK